MMKELGKAIFFTTAIALCVNTISTVNTPSLADTDMAEESAMNTNIGISSDDRKAVAQMLNTVLADLYVLYQKTWGFHWNVTGPFFNDLHAFFQKQFEQLRVHIDDVAERILQLGHHADIRLSDFLAQSQIQESDHKSPEASQMVGQLLADHEAIIRLLRINLEQAAQYNDMGTNNMLTDLMQRHEKMAWMLRAIATK